MDKSLPSAVWTRPSCWPRCIDFRYNSCFVTEMTRHEDDEADDPWTACRHCQRKGIPCVMSTRGRVPIVLPLPVGKRLEGATEGGEGYFFVSGGIRMPNE